MLSLQRLHGEVVLLLGGLLLGEGHVPVVHVLLVILVGGIDICLAVFRKLLRCDIVRVRLGGGICGSGMATCSSMIARSATAATAVSSGFFRSHDTEIRNLGVQIVYLSVYAVYLLLGIVDRLRGIRFRIRAEEFRDTSHKTVLWMKDVVCLYIMIGLILLVSLVLQVVSPLVQVHQFVLVCLQLDFLLQRNEIVINGTLVVPCQSALFREQAIITRNNLLEFIESLLAAVHGDLLVAHGFVELLHLGGLLIHLGVQVSLHGFQFLGRSCCLFLLFVHIP